MIDHSDKRTVSLGFHDERVSEGQHICYIYNDDEERLQVMAKFFESGLEEQEKLLYMVDVMTPSEMLDCLEDLGVDAREQPSQFKMCEAVSTYCPGGTFNSQEMLELVQNFYTDALDEDFVGARGTGEMSWCLDKGEADLESMMEYEAGLNYVLEKYPLTACCQYDARRFDGATILDALAVHPMMIVKGQLVHNPYYVKPAEFLRKYRERRQHIV